MSIKVNRTGAGLAAAALLAAGFTLVGSGPASAGISGAYCGEDQVVNVYAGNQNHLTCFSPGSYSVGIDYSWRLDASLYFDIEVWAYTDTYSFTADDDQNGYESIPSSVVYSVSVQFYG